MSEGIDAAQMDLNGGKIDAAALKKSGVTFAIIRKSQCYKSRSGQFVLAADPTYRDFADELRSAGIKVGAYIFPRFDRGTPSMENQFANFQASGPARQQGDLPDFVDVEFSGNGIADTNRSQADVAADVLALTRLVAASSRAGVYTSHVQTHDTNGLGGKLSPEIGKFVLWQKVPYHLGAFHPLDGSPTVYPHIGPASWDPNGYWRVPDAWANSGYWIVQKQGDQRGTIQGIYQCDVNVWNTLSKTSAPNDPRIRGVQQQLAELGYEMTVTGSWDQNTEDAIRRVQTAAKLDDDAVIGVDTYCALYP
jgi:hypothetical protein